MGTSGGDGLAGWPPLTLQEWSNWEARRRGCRYRRARLAGAASDGSAREQLVCFLLWWIPAFTYYSLIVRIRNIAEHSVTPGETNLNNTRTTKASLLIRYLMVPHRVNFHLEHHLFTNCPWYNLPKAHEMLNKASIKDSLCIENSYFSVLKKATSG